MNTNRKIWKEVYFDHFPIDFFGLSRYEQWVVGLTLQAMIRQRNPLRGREYTACGDCIPDTYSLGVVDDGLGNKGLALQIHLDRQNGILTPMSVVPVQRPPT